MDPEKLTEGKTEKNKNKQKQKKTMKETTSTIPITKTILIIK